MRESMMLQTFSMRGNVRFRGQSGRSRAARCMSAYSQKRTFRTSLHRHQLIKDGCQVDEAAGDCDVGDVSDSERVLGRDPEIAIMS